MKLKLSLLILVIFSACVQNEKRPKVNSSNDTTIGSKSLNYRIAGSTYLKRETEYFVVKGRDTSEFTCVFKESKTGKVSIETNYYFLKTSLPYSERLAELGLILQRASKEFNFDSLKYINYGRLVQNGDLAIEITNSYLEKYSTFKNIFIDHKKLKDFILASKLTSDLNLIFKPYSIIASKVSIEKLFLTTKEDLYWSSTIETDSALVPNKILDCLVIVGMKKSK